MTADQDLSARLAELHGRRLESAHAYSAAISAIVEAYRSGQLITLADHERAVQAAVAKAVEAERERLLQWCDQIMGSVEGCIDLNAAEENSARIWTDNFAAAIRSRGVSAPVAPANEGGV